MYQNCKFLAVRADSHGGKALTVHQFAASLVSCSTSSIGENQLLSGPPRSYFDKYHHFFTTVTLFRQPHRASEGARTLGENDFFALERERLDYFDLLLVANM